MMGTTFIMNVLFDWQTIRSHLDVKLQILEGNQSSPTPSTHLPLTPPYQVSAVLCLVDVG